MPSTVSTQWMLSFIYYCFKDLASSQHWHFLWKDYPNTPMLPRDTLFLCSRDLWSQEQMQQKNTWEMTAHLVQSQYGLRGQPLPLEADLEFILSHLRQRPCLTTRPSEWRITLPFSPFPAYCLMTQQQAGSQQHCCKDRPCQQSLFPARLGSQVCFLSWLHSNLWSG